MNYKIFLPALTGIFANWRYYQVIMKVENIVEIIGKSDENKSIYRIRSVDEVEEIHSKEINEMLQRVFDKSRLNPLKNYLTKQKDKYVNNLTIAIYGGEPEWLPISLHSSDFKEYDNNIAWELFGKSFGIIKLSGAETLFVLDGQHRLKALREAVKLDPELKNQEVAITLVTHFPSEAGKKKTRRLFTTINRYAKPVSDGESILLDEDDLSSILVRRIIEEYKLFSGKSIIAQNKTSNLSLPAQNSKLTSVISLWNVNETLINHKEIYPKFEGSKKNMVRIRPSDKVIEREKDKIFSYWDLFFKLFPLALVFVEKSTNGEDIKEFRKNGGYFYLRPIGQEVIFQLIYYLEANSLHSFIPKISDIEDKLDSKFWHYVLWDPIKKNMLKNKGYAKLYLLYHLGVELTHSQLDSLKRNYKKNSGDLQLDLPKQYLI